MKKQLIIVGTMLVLLTVGLSGCVQQKTGLESDNEPYMNEETPFVEWVRQLVDDNEYNQQKLTEALWADDGFDIHYYSDKGKNMMREAEGKLEKFTNLSGSDSNLINDVKWYIYYCKGDYEDVKKSQEYYEDGNYDMSDFYLEQSRNKLDEADSYRENISEKID